MGLPPPKDGATRSACSRSALRAPGPNQASAYGRRGGPTARSQCEPERREGKGALSNRAQCLENGRRSTQPMIAFAAEEDAPARSSGGSGHRAEESAVCAQHLLERRGRFRGQGRWCARIASSQAPRAFPRPRKVLCVHSIFSSAEGVSEATEGAVYAQHLLERRGRFRGQGRCCVCTASSQRRAVVDSVHSKWYSIEYEASARASARY